MATLDTIEHAEIEFQLPHMANFTEACRGSSLLRWVWTRVYRRIHD